ncbi:unnamed protein product, partial [Prorocentrum cordatum]
TAACPVYKVIGNEFCGTVGECMFTVFRCYMGDCSKLDGTSMIPELSKHYGAKFNISYAAGMILVMLGLFNVVTAVFVHSVEEGISNEERSYKKKHEWAGKNIRRKLKKFCNYVQMNHNHNFGGKCQFQDQTWTAAQLTAIFKDPRATSILSELDIDASEYCGTDAVDTYNLYNKIRLTDVFDIDEIDGIVNAEKMLSTLAYMQGLTHMDRDVMTSLKIQQLQRFGGAAGQGRGAPGGRRREAPGQRGGHRAGACGRRGERRGEPARGPDRGAPQEEDQAQARCGDPAAGRPRALMRAPRRRRKRSALGAAHVDEQAKRHTQQNVQTSWGHQHRSLPPSLLCPPPLSLPPFSCSGALVSIIIASVTTVVPRRRPV